MDNEYYGDDGTFGASLTQDERDFIRLIRYSTWRMARTVAEQAPEYGDRFIEYLREELRRVRNEKRPAGLVKPKK